MKISRYTYLILVIVIFIFNGCTTINNPIPKVIKSETKILKVNVPNEYLIRQEIPKPPNKEIFLLLDYNTRMSLLTDYLKELMKKLKASNDNIEEIKKWNDTK